MRPILALALVCLALTLALNHARTLFPGPAQPSALADRALDVVLGAKGALLPPAAPGGEAVGECIRFGDRTLTAPGRTGLRAAVLARNGEPRLERVLDLAGAPTAGAELLALVESLAPGEVLALASSGRLAPRDGRALGPDFERALALLGARARPATATPESWALLALRIERGCVPLAEAYGRESGVALAFTLTTERERYAGFVGDFALARAPRESVVELAGELAHAAQRTRVEPAFVRRVGGRPLDGLVLAPAEDAPARLAWDDVPLDAGAGLVAWLGLADDASPGSDGVELVVRVAGERVHAETVLPGAAWRVVQVDLRRFAGQSVELELAAEARAHASGDVLLVGRPLLVRGFERPPLEVLAGER